MPLIAHWYVLLVMLVFWGGLIALVIWAFRASGRRIAVTAH